MPTKDKQPSQLFILLAFASIYLIWGSTFLAVLYGLEGFPPFVLSGLRFFIAGLILLVFLYTKNEKPLSWKSWANNGVAGTLVLVGGTGMVAWAEQFIPSSEACVIAATGPFWFTALDRKNWKYYFSNPVIVTGLVTGFAGLILFTKGSFTQEVANTNGSLKTLAFALLVISSISWVAGSLYSRSKKSSKQSTIMNVAQQLVAAGIVCFIVALFRSEWQSFSFAQVSVKAWLSLGYLIIFGSIIAYISYIWLLSVKKPVLVSTHTYVNPIVAVVLGWLFAGEYINSIQLGGLITILAGVALMQLSGFKPSKRLLVKLRYYNYVISRMVNPNKYITG